MTEITPTLYIGTPQDIPVVNARRVINLSSKYHQWLHPGLEPSDHCYIVHEEPRLLSVNWVDADDPKYFNYQDQGVETCKRILDFLTRHQSDVQLIVCDQGISRSPTVALLYLVKRLHWFESCHGYEEAAKAFTESFYSSYNPNLGIRLFVEENWFEIQ